jgi:UDP-glucuronate 4-epimerase
MAEILLTGCAGFIGSHLCEKLLAQGHRVTGIDNFDPFYPRPIKEGNLAVFSANRNFSFHEMDIRDSRSLHSMKGEFSLIIHLASKAGVRPSIADPASYIAVNVGGTESILTYMKEKGIKKMIFGSSSSIYGNNKTTPFRESDPVNDPISPYAVSKRSAELLNHSFHHLHQLDIINLRFFTVFGPRQRPDLAIRKFAELISTGRPVPVYGDGSTARDYTYVDDITDGIILAADHLFRTHKVFETINLGNSYPVSLHELVQQLHAIMGKEVKIERLPKQAGDVDITFADISKAASLLGYAPKMRFEEGLRSFVNWFRSAT